MAVETIGGKTMTIDVKTNELDERLLTISKFAQAVGTTRRTLLFYDEKGVFKPAKTTANGYRYYSYGQIYRINFILGLRSLGLSVDEIKSYLADNNSQTLNKELGNLKQRVEDQIAKLRQVLEVLDQKEANNIQLTDVDFYTVKRCYLPPRDFWVSDFKVNCSEKEIAQAYSDFYQRLGAGTMVTNRLSGFLTDLPQAQPNKYADAGFRIIKEKSQLAQVKLPVMTQADGDFLITKVQNTGEGIEKGLAKIRQFAQTNNLQIGDDLWQFNIGVDIARLGLTKNSILAYRINQ